MRSSLGERAYGNPIGFWMVIFAAAMGWLTMGVVTAQTASPTLTQITDTLYNSDGSTAQGTLNITWPSFVMADSTNIAAGNLSVALGARGSLSVYLACNTGSTPASSYHVVMHLNSGTPTQEDWTVPCATQTTRTAILSTLEPAAVAKQYVGRDYVDTKLSAIQSSLFSANTSNTFSNGTTETFDGVKANTFAASTLNSAYATISGGLIDATAIGAKTPATGNFTTATATTLSASTANLTAVTSNTETNTTLTSNYAAFKGRPWFDVNAFGADPTGATDSTAAIKAAIAASCFTNGYSGVTYFPAGTYMVTDLDLTSGLTCTPTLYSPNDNGVKLVYGGTGGLGEYMIKLSNMSFGAVSGFYFLGANPSTGAMAQYGLWLTGSVDLSFAIQHDRFALFLTNAIYHSNSSGFVNWHMDHIRFDRVGGCAVQITGTATMQGRPFSIDNWTFDNVYPNGLSTTWVQAKGWGDGTHWGDAVVCVNNGQGIAVTLSNARVEFNAPQVVIGNLDNASLVREWNNNTAPVTVALNNVQGYGSPLHEPLVTSQYGRAELTVQNSQFASTQGCVKNVAAQVVYGDTNCARSMVSFGYSAQLSGGLYLGAYAQQTQRIESLPDPYNSSNSIKFRANDIVLHPSSEAAAGTKGPMRYVTAPATGSCKAGAYGIAATAAMTSGAYTITGVNPAANYIAVGDNISITGAGISGAALTAQVTGVDNVNNIITVDTAASTSVSGAMITWQACTFHELPGATTGTTAPTSGVWAAGEKVWNSLPSSGNPAFWVCTASGTAAGGCPGAWLAGPNYGSSATSFPLTNSVSDTSGNMIALTQSGAGTTGAALITAATTSSTGSSYPMKLMNSSTANTFILALVDSVGTNATFSTQNTFLYHPVTISQQVTATSGANYSSSKLNLQGAYYNGTSSATSTLTLQNVLGSGTTPTSTLALTNAGTSGTVVVDLTAAATVKTTALTVGGSSVLPVLTGTSSSIGGSALAAGACTSSSVIITGATTSMVVHVSPAGTYPGDGFWFQGYVSTANNVKVQVCAVVAGTPTAATYNVRVIQ